MIGNPHRSARISAGATCRQCRQPHTAPDRLGLDRGDLRPRRWARMNHPSAGAGKKLASPRWRQPLPTRWARRSAANAVITLPIMRIAPSGWWQVPRPATSPSIASRRGISARRARKSTTAANSSAAARRPARTALPRAGRMLMLTPTSRALMLLLSRVLAGAAKAVRQAGRKV